MADALKLLPVNATGAANGLEAPPVATNPPTELVLRVVNGAEPPVDEKLPSVGA